MSLGKTLLKVAIGVAIVKGVTSMTKGSAAEPATTGGTAGLGRGTRIDGKGQGGLEDLLGEILGSGGSPKTGGKTDRTTGGTGTGGLGDLLTQMSGQKRQTPRKTAPKGGLEDLLGELTGQGAELGADHGAPRDSDATVGGSRGGARGGSGGIGDLLDQVLNDRTPGRKVGAPVALPEPRLEEELSAALMLRAVIQAVKCDGELDEDEKARLMKAMGDADAREVQAVNAELQRPVDVAGLARSVPAGLEPQVYVVSLMAINLDQKAEAQYLHNLAQALDLSQDQVNALHDRARAPRLYR